MSGKNNRRGYMVTVAVLLSIVALMHILRVLMGWDMFVGGTFIPAWVSLLAAGILGYLAYRGFKKKAK